MGMLFQAFKRFVADNGLLSEGERAVVAVSGGIDSMVMLHLLARLSKTMKLDLIVAHANHGLRGKESDGDEEFVRGAAEGLGLALFTRRLKPQEGENVQDAARRLRFKFLTKLAKDSGARSVCLGHNMGDQAETILIHMIRGSGLSGLCGMRPLTALGPACVVRPLLFATRDEIAAYACEAGVAYREDSTNAKRKYRRNDVRLGIMPILREINPRVVENLAMMGRRLAQDDEALDRVAEASLVEAALIATEEEIVLDGNVYAGLPVAIRKRLMKLAYARLCGSSADLNSDQLERMDAIATGMKVRGEYRLKAPWKFTKSGGRLYISKAPPRPGSIAAAPRKRR
jgi:tRNA(Ile)-lysidine synthase